jgi:hypothetical protein
MGALLDFLFERDLVAANVARSGVNPDPYALSLKDFPDVSRKAARVVAC